MPCDGVRESGAADALNRKHTNNAFPIGQLAGLAPHLPGPALPQHRLAVGDSERLNKQTCHWSFGSCLFLPFIPEWAALRISIKGIVRTKKHRNAGLCVVRKDRLVLLLLIQCRKLFSTYCSFCFCPGLGSAIPEFRGAMSRAAPHLIRQHQTGQ